MSIQRSDRILNDFRFLITEYCGPLCAQYQHIFLQPILEYTKDKAPEVRQAATYGCGVLAQVLIDLHKRYSMKYLFFLFSLRFQFAGEQFAVPCAQCVPTLVEMINAPRSREPEFIHPTENAISAITKILKYNSSALTNTDELIHLW